MFIFKDHLHISNLICSSAIFNFLESAVLLDVCRWVVVFCCGSFFHFPKWQNTRGSFHFLTQAPSPLLWSLRRSLSTYVYIYHSEIVFSATCRVVEALPLPFPYKIAVTHACFLQNPISRLQLFNNLMRLGLSFLTDTSRHWAPFWKNS